jgi:L-lysine 2,3-aminomutase
VGALQIPVQSRINKPTDRQTVDIVFVILAGGQPLTLSEVGELEQIQRELQRRDELEGARLCQTAIGLRNL